MRRLLTNFSHVHIFIAARDKAKSLHTRTDRHGGGLLLLVLMPPSVLAPPSRGRAEEEKTAQRAWLSQRRRAETHVHLQQCAFETDSETDIVRERERERMNGRGVDRQAVANDRDEQLLRPYTWRVLLTSSM